MKVEQHILVLSSDTTKENVSRRPHSAPGFLRVVTGVVYNLKPHEFEMNYSLQLKLPMQFSKISLRGALSKSEHVGILFWP